MAINTAPTYQRAQLDPSTDWFTQNAPPTNKAMTGSTDQSMIPTIGFAESRESYFNRLRSIGIDPNTVNMGTEADAQDYLKQIQSRNVGQPTNGGSYNEKAVQEALNNPNVANSFPPGSPEWIALAKARQAQLSPVPGTKTYAPGTGPANLGQAANPGGYPANLGQMGSQPGGGDWISQALSAAQSTDDPNYWRGVIAKDPKVAAGDQSAIDYWKGRIAQGDGAAAVRNGTTQPANGGASSGPGSPTDIMNQDPGFQFRMGEGLKALQHSAAARGTLLTGGTQKALERYGQDYASGEFGNVFNRNLSLADLGQRSAASATQAGTSYANNASNTTEDVGNTTAAGQVGSANATTGAIGAVANTAEREAYLRWLNGQTGTTNTGISGLNPPTSGPF